MNEEKITTETVKEATFLLCGFYLSGTVDLRTYINILLFCSFSEINIQIYYASEMVILGHIVLSAVRNE